ncbi:MAG TPA: amylo-alpha-1,6-glucosidase [Ktedonobacterales bacterium]
MGPHNEFELPQLQVALPASIDDALTHEWLVTNGAGGYAMGSLPGAPTRGYHGYLIAAPRVPQERLNLVTQLIETVTLSDGREIALCACENSAGGFSPNGYPQLRSFTLDGLIPRFTFQLAPGLTLEKTIWMEHGSDMTFVRYHCQAEEAAAPITLRIQPYCVYRDHHAEQHGAPDWKFDVLPITLAGASGPVGCTVRARPDAVPYYLIGGAARFIVGGSWRWGIKHRVERERGLNDTEDVYIPGEFTISLEPGTVSSLVIATGAFVSASADESALGGVDHESAVEAAYQRERARQRALLTAAGAPTDEFVARLTLAADQFIVGRRPPPAVFDARQADPAVTIIAGYPWFTDWGRDSMIALPGLLLGTGRAEEARGLIRGFAGFMSEGMIPNGFPDSADSSPEYNTVDATLWLFHAIDRYLEAHNDQDLLEELFPALDSVILWHARGTRYGIRVDPSDGLLYAGAEGIQLTWMDAKVDDWVVTPRRGKPVEINALWYRAMTLITDWARRLGHDEADIAVYQALAAQVRANFAARFWSPDCGYLFDVVDVNGQPGATDPALRPNQIIALAVAPELVSPSQGRSAIEKAQSALLAPLGLRTLSPSDPAYLGQYGGDRRTRDAAYHQGTVWPWLIGAYADAHTVFFPEEDSGSLHARLLAPFKAHLSVAGSGSISEVTSGDPPFALGGCPYQAWSVAEALRLAQAPQ